jgi:hypothetical protein
MSNDLDYEIIVMCVENNIRRGSRNVKDYERGKTLINELFPDRYEEAIVDEFCRKHIVYETREKNGAYAIFREL